MLLCDTDLSQMYVQTARVKCKNKEHKLPKSWVLSVSLTENITLTWNAEMEKKTPKPLKKPLQPHHSNQTHWFWVLLS